MTVRSKSQTPDSISLSRHDFLALATRAVLGLVSLLGLGEILSFLGHQSTPANQTEFDLGPAEDYPLNSRTLLQEPGALLVHTPAGFEALSLTCPHLGCQVNPQEDGFACPCHGSQFKSNGALLRGPAGESLKSLRVEINEQGHLMLYTV
jgi:cytochrome b6-f complex iron-sulfur subunit